jgi:membrane protease subunit HflC
MANLAIERQRRLDSAARRVRKNRIHMAEARKQSEILRGQGDAQAVKIFADAYGRNPDFYQLVRTLEAYRISITEGTTLILSPNSEFFRYLKQLDRPKER